MGNRTVTLTVPTGKGGEVASCAMEWAPDLPGRLSAEEINQYRKGRNAALLDIARELGVRIALVDLP